MTDPDATVERRAEPPVPYRSDPRLRAALAIACTAVVALSVAIFVVWNVLEGEVGANRGQLRDLQDRVASLCVSHEPTGPCAPPPTTTTSAPPPTAPPTTARRTTTTASTARRTAPATPRSPTPAAPAATTTTTATTAPPAPSTTAPPRPPSTLLPCVGQTCIGGKP